MELSVIITAYNEEKTIVPLCRKLTEALRFIGDFEIIIVDDGSTDGTSAALCSIEDDRVHTIRLQRNAGKSRALLEGIDMSRGRFIATLDADLQDDPADIPRVYNKLKRGFDAVFGVRVIRKDSFVRRFESRFANGFANLFLGENYRDRGGPVKGFRKSVLLTIPRFDGMHRFFPTLLRRYRTTEIEVNHRPRLYGISKMRRHIRMFKALRDTFYIKKLIRRGMI